MRTYLVTGGAGFIGSNYIHYMFRKYDNEIRIINVDALTYAGNLENLKDIENRDNYTFIRADITDKEAITKIFTEREISISGINSKTSKQGIATISVSFSVKGKEELERLVEKVRQIESVIDIERTTG